VTEQKRVSFWDVFRSEQGGLRLLRAISVNGLDYAPGLSHKGNWWGGVDFMRIQGRDLAVKAGPGPWEIKGYYPNPINPSQPLPTPE
jgi:hypothetical protein